MRRSILVGSAVGVGVLVAGWLAVNPGGRFGVSTSMLTTYNRLPLPFVDMQVRSDGAMRVVGKVHRIGTDRLAWLAEPKPEVLIIAGGWQGDARAIGPLERFEQARLMTPPTGEALKGMMLTPLSRFASAPRRWNRVLGATTGGAVQHVAQPLGARA